MITNSLEAFPAAGVDIHVSIDEAEAHGLGPGDPAIIETTVRPYTVEEWLVEGSSRTFASEEDEAEFYARCPVPGAAPDPQRALAPVPAATAVAEPERITWKAGRVGVADPPAAAAEPEPEPEPEPVDSVPDRISWRSGGPVAA